VTGEGAEGGTAEMGKVMPRNGEAEGGGYQLIIQQGQHGSDGSDRCDPFHAFSEETEPDGRRRLNLEMQRATACHGVLGLKRPTARHMQQALTRRLRRCPGRGRPSPA
jgi:hypothetical protein